MKDCRELYEALAESVPPGVTVEETFSAARWAFARCGGAGIALAAGSSGIAPLYADGLASLSVREAAEAVMSWDFTEAAQALAAVNAALNTPDRLEALDCYLPFERHYTDDLDFRGKTVGIIGHMHGSERMRREAERIYTLEREPQSGDYPDSACEWLLPRCDIVLITGSSMVNKTLPRLLSLSERAFTVLTGPSVPLCPALLDFGIDRLAGMVVHDADGLREHVVRGQRGNPYAYAYPFVLSK